MSTVEQEESVNVFGEKLETCSDRPVTGFFRDGCCNTGEQDIGSHTVCILATQEFLEYSRFKGNDLSTPVPEWGFICGSLRNISNDGPIPGNVNNYITKVTKYTKKIFWFSNSL